MTYMINMFKSKNKQTYVVLKLQTFKQANILSNINKSQKCWQKPTQPINSQEAELTICTFNIFKAPVDQGDQEYFHRIR